MKKIIFSTALSLAALASSTTSSAQDIAGGIYMGARSSRVTDPSSGKSFRILSVSEVNVKAARDFGRHYAKAENIAWVANNNGSSVYFTFKGNKMRSTYNKAGQKEYTLKYYSEQAMDPKLRHLIKSNYYDFTIDMVTEVERNNSTSYLVRMQDAKQFLTVKVVDGEIFPYETIQKVSGE